MNRRTLVTWMAMAVAVTGAGSAWWARQATREHEKAAALSRRERAALEAAVAQLEHDLPASGQRATQSDSAVATPVVAVEQRRGRLPVRRLSPGPTDPPAAQVGAIEALKARLPLRYGTLYRQLGLTPAQTARFEAIVVEHDGRLRDLRATEAGIKIDRATAVSRERVSLEGRRVKVLEDASIGALRREEEARYQGELTNLLGAAGYTHLQGFEAGAECRAMVAELVGNLALTDAPLSRVQGEQLTRVLQQAGFTSKIDPTSNDWAALARHARAILLLRQFEEFEAQLTAARHDATRRVTLPAALRSWRPAPGKS